jgi:hypothetical protein
MLDNIPSEKTKCHRCNFEKSCRELVLSGACGRWSKISGTHPQTGELMDKWACVDDLTHILLLEVANQTSKVSVELNILRNETAKAHAEQLSMGAIAVQRSGNAVRTAFKEAAEARSLSSAVPMLIEGQKTA